MAQFKRNTFKKKKTVKSVRKVIAKNNDKIFKKKVLKITQGEKEDKMMSVIADPVALAPQINAVTDLKQLVPAIGQGYGNHQRIGDSIMGKYLEIRGHLELSTSANNSDGPTRVLCRLMVVSDKRNSNYDKTNADFCSALIDYGSQDINFDGQTGGAVNVRSLYMPLNRDAVTVHYDKLHYLNIPRTYNTTGTQFSNVNFENTIKIFNIRVSCKKLLRYTDQSSFPQNFNPLLCCGFAQLNGGANTTNLVRLHYCSKLVYEDNN